MKVVLLLLVLLVVVAYLLTQSTQHISVYDGGKRTADIVKDLKLYPASKFENVVREKIEKLTGKKFPCVYPSWLKYKGKNLELDGYNSELKLAFETQGPQHTRYSKTTDAYRTKYKNRVANDRAKIKLCKENNVGLIIVDYKVPKHLMGSYIRSRIYDISEQWKSLGLFNQIEKLGILSHKAGDYISPIINKASFE